MLRVAVWLWAGLGGAAMCYGQVAICAFNMTDPPASRGENGVVQWLSDVDRIGPDRFRSVNAVHNLDRHVRNINWPAGRMRVRRLAPDTTAFLCRDDVFGDAPQKSAGQLWYGNTGADVTQTRVWHGEYGAEEVRTLEKGQPVKVMKAEFVAVDQPKLESKGSRRVAVSFQMDVSGAGSRRQIAFEVRNEGSEAVRVWLPDSDEMSRQLRLGSGGELRPGEFRKASAMSDADLFFVQLPVVIYSTKSGLEAVIYVTAAAPSLRPQ